MRTLASTTHLPIAKNTKERKPVRLTRRAKTALTIATVGLGVSVVAGNKTADSRENAHDVAMLKELQADKQTVTVRAEPLETNKTFLARAYKTVPEDVGPALMEFLKSKETNDKGKYVGLLALHGYDLPARGQGLVLQPDIEKEYQLQQEEAQKIASEHGG